MNLIYVIHLMCWNYLIDLITQSRKRNNRNNSGDGDNKGGARASRAPPFVVAVNSVVSLSALCDQVDQGDQVVPAHQVDDIDEVHQLDPVHQVDHKDECSKISLQKRHHNAIRWTNQGSKKTPYKPSRPVILLICFASFRDLFFH